MSTQFDWHTFPEYMHAHTNFAYNKIYTNTPTDHPQAFIECVYYLNITSCAVETQRMKMFLAEVICWLFDLISESICRLQPVKFGDKTAKQDCLSPAVLCIDMVNMLCGLGTPS